MVGVVSFVPSPSVVAVNRRRYPCFAVGSLVLVTRVQRVSADGKKALLETVAGRRGVSESSVSWKRYSYPAVKPPFETEVAHYYGWRNVVVLLVHPPSVMAVTVDCRRYRCLVAKSLELA